MKRIYKKMILGYLMLFASAVIFGNMIVPYNGSMWILKIMLFWVLVQCGYITVDRCNREICDKMKEEKFNKIRKDKVIVK